MSERDFENAVSEAIVAVLDGAVAVTALTGRATRNIVPYDVFADEAVPCLSYFVVGITRTGGVGDTRQVQIQFESAAQDTPDRDGKSLADDLIYCVETLFTTAALNGLPTQLDACVLDFQRIGVPGRAADGTSSAMLDLTLLVTL